MKIATTTGDLSAIYKTDEERVHGLADAGFRHIDLDMYSFTPNCAYMSDEWKKETEKLKIVAAKTGVDFVQAHSQGGNPLSTDEEEAEFIVAATVRSIEICRELGIKNTVVHSGVIEGASKEEWFEKNREFYKRLFPAMERCEVNVLCENSTAANMRENYFINSGKDMREFIDYVDHPMFHGCWDTGHANCEGSQYDDILAIGKHLYAIHYNDNHGKSDEHIALYFGTLNHDEVIHALLDVGYEGYFTLESTSSLVQRDHWLGARRVFKKDERLLDPPNFLYEDMEKTLYKTAKYILEAYDLFED